MLKAVIHESKNIKNIFLLTGLFFLFLIVYIFLDFEGNTNYTVMTENFGITTVIIHFLLNVVIALLSSIMVGFSVINYRLTKIEPKGSSAIPFLSFVLGLLTFGCTSCVIAFFSAIGITFTPIVFPQGNLLWKIITTIFVFLGFVWIMYIIQNSKCKIKTVKE